MLACSNCPKPRMPLWRLRLLKYATNDLAVSQNNVIILSACLCSGSWHWDCSGGEGNDLDQLVAHVSHCALKSASIEALAVFCHACSVHGELFKLPHVENIFCSLYAARVNRCRLRGLSCSAFERGANRSAARASMGKYLLMVGSIKSSHLIA